MNKRADSQRMSPTNIAKKKHSFGIFQHVLTHFSRPPEASKGSPNRKNAQRPGRFQGTVASQASARHPPRPHRQTPRREKPLGMSSVVVPNGTSKLQTLSNTPVNIQFEHFEIGKTIQNQRLFLSAPQKVHKMFTDPSARSILHPFNLATWLWLLWVKDGQSKHPAGGSKKDFDRLPSKHPSNLSLKRLQRKRLVLFIPRRSEGVVPSCCFFFKTRGAPTRCSVYLLPGKPKQFLLS